MPETKQYLYQLFLNRTDILTGGPTGEEAEILGAHFNYLQELASQDIVLLAGRTQNDDPSTFGIVILQAESDEAAQQLMDKDPAVVHKVMNATLYPYKIASLSSAWDSAATQ